MSFGVIEPIFKKLSGKYGYWGSRYTWGCGKPNLKVVNGFLEARDPDTQFLSPWVAHNTPFRNPTFSPMAQIDFLF